MIFILFFKEARVCAIFLVFVISLVEASPILDRHRRPSCTQLNVSLRLSAVSVHSLRRSSLPVSRLLPMSRSSHPSSFSKLMPHTRIEGLLISNENTLYTKNLVPGEAHNHEKLHTVKNDDGTEVEYREWDPSKSKLAAAILCGADNICIKPGSRVLCLGVACGTTISHISDLVGPEGFVYVVEFNNWRTLVKLAEKRFNIIPIVQSPILACKYRVLVNIVDVMFADVDNLAQALEACVNARNYLKSGGYYIIYVKVSRGEDVFASCLGRKETEFIPMERITLQPFDEHYAYDIGVYRTLESEPALDKIDSRSSRSFTLSGLVGCI